MLTFRFLSSPLLASSSTMAEQIEKSFQKQPLFHNAKFATSSKKVAGKDRRWYKDVGLGFKVRCFLWLGLAGGQGAHEFAHVRA
jgi:hypothetical protein